MRKILFLFSILIIFSLISCVVVEEQPVQQVELKKPAVMTPEEKAAADRLASRAEVVDGMAVPYELTEEAHQKALEAKRPKIEFNIYRALGNVNIDVKVPEEGWGYSSMLSNDGLTYSLTLRDVSRKLGDVKIIRPIIGLSRTDYPSGYKLVFKLVSKHSLMTTQNEDGLHIALKTIDPDMEMQSLLIFGGWADPVRQASSFRGIEHKKDTTKIFFDSLPLYTTGKAGGRFFIDIFGVNILPGTVKHKGLLDTSAIKGKTRLIFTDRINFCPDGNSLILGKECMGYGGLAWLERYKTDTAESFSFSLPGKPDMIVNEMQGLVAFGFKDTKMFSPILSKYDDGGVYKVEAREKDGILWLIFLFEDGMKYRKYYSGDKFFVVFYR